MTGRSGSGSPGVVPRTVVICCAGARRRGLEPAVERLENDGHKVALVDDLERGAEALDAALERHGPGALFVLCRGPELERECIDDARRQLRRRGVPFERTLTISGDVTSEIVSRVVAALERLGGMRKLPPPPPRPSAARDSDELPTIEELTTVDRRQSGGVPGAPLGRLELLNTAELSRFDVMDDELDPASLLPPVRTGHTELIRVREPSVIAPLPTTPVVIPTSASTMHREGDDASTIPEPVPPPIPVFAIPERPIPRPSQPTVAPAPSEPHADWAIQHRAWLWAGGGALAAVALAFVAWPRPDPQLESEAARESTGAAANLQSEPPPERRAALPAEPELHMPGQAPTRAMEALRAREVRAIDWLLVTARETAAMDHAAAEQHCSNLDVRGLAEWRLPSIGELGSIARADMLQPAHYWSSTSADTYGDAYLAYDGKRQVAVARNSAAVLCVRGPDAAR